MEWLAMGGFVCLLVLSVVLGFPLVPALLGGYGLFFLYGLYRKNTPAALWQMSLRGLKTVGTILFLFVLIGVITALWRACGTIPFLIYYTSGLISPAVFFLLAFLFLLFANTRDLGVCIFGAVCCGALITNVILKDNVARLLPF